MVFLSSRISPRTATVILRERSPLATAVVTSAMLRTWPGEIAGHGVHRVGEIFPRTGHAAHIGLAAENPFGADFARHAGHFRGERVELIDHRVDGVLEFEDFAAHVDGDFARKVAVGDGGGDFGDVADLGSEVAGHGVDRVGQIFPDAGDAFHFRLAAQFAFGTDFARHAGDFRCERSELIDHGVDGVLELENFALHIHGDLAGKIAVGHGCGDLGDVADLGGQIAGHGVDGIGEILPDAGDAFHLGLAAQFALGSDFARHARNFRSERVQLRDHGVHHARGVQELALERAAVHFESHGLREVALGDRADHARHFRGGLHQIADEAVD